MGLDPIAFGALACLCVLATAVSSLAFRRAGRALTRDALAEFEQRARANALLWEETCKALQREVSHELDRVESRRRAVATVESRLKAKEENGQVAEVQAEQEQLPDLSQLDRAQLRALRRMGGS